MKESTKSVIYKVSLFVVFSAWSKVIGIESVLIYMGVIILDELRKLEANK